PYPIQAHSFPDHYNYRSEDFRSGAFSQNNPIVMTEKDGIKCETFADSRFWFLDVEVQVDSDLLTQVSEHARHFFDQ
ncbi:MAG: tetraacyldisaccharide 4'-kinase, partial [Pseudomonadota bacterium]|nr:tetraacyldisaccharide 4'-kinase [Pseudomonadota bacterium]